MGNKGTNRIKGKGDIEGFSSGQKWLTEEDARFANQERDGLLRSLYSKARYSFMQSKLHLGELSPGCSICGKGYWSCLFINGLCTANCFFCPQDRKVKKERPPVADIVFDDPNDYVDYLKKFNFKGVGFSGGETLLVFEKLLTYIKKIRERFGESIYLWIYTNGDLVDKDKLMRLKEAGLNEIRFNISANGYDLRPVALASGIIDTVTVEIPAIPEDLEVMKGCLTRMRRIGVDFLNIHQMETTKYNYKNCVRRGYTFLHTKNVDILESETAALKLIRHALDNKIGLPINYCSSAFKHRFQLKGKRERYARLVKKYFEDFTSAGYIRRLSIKDSLKNISKIIKTLPKNTFRRELWSLNDRNTEIFLHKSLLKRINFDKHSLIVSYFEPQLRAGSVAGEGLGDEIRLNRNKTVFIRKKLVGRQEFPNKRTIETFQKVFIENMDWHKALNCFFRNYKLKPKADLNELMKETDRVFALKRWEHQEVGFPELH